MPRRNSNAGKRKYLTQQGIPYKAAKGMTLDEFLAFRTPRSTSRTKANTGGGSSRRRERS